MDFMGLALGLLPDGLYKPEAVRAYMPAEEIRLRAGRCATVLSCGAEHDMGGRAVTAHDILAVLEKRLGLRFSSVDVYLNVIGGIRIEETASDVGVALALISSVRDIPVPDDLLCIGELGLSGEVRAVSHIESRVTEAARLGFKKIILPSRSAKAVRKVPEGVTLIPIKSIFEVLTILK